MELSICIPLYNSRPIALIKALSQQLESLKLKAEILIIDDASLAEISKENQLSFAQMPWVRYVVLERNIGRAKMRNLLVAEAKGEFLLMLDGDARMVKKDFISHYWHLRKANTVLVGGRTVGSIITNCELRWFYTVEREILSAEQRQNRPYASFMTGNYFCDSTIFQKLKFDENIRGYGHEDTVFGLELEKYQVPIIHIENPLLFEADDSNIDFLEKSEEALRNLQALYPYYPDLKDKVRILKLALKLKGLGLALIYQQFYKLFRKSINANLTSANPSLRYFDLFRLNYLLASID